MRIGQLATEVGVPVATIRFYEQEGLIDKPARTDANYRAYGPDVFQRLGFIQRCRSLGIRIAEIRRLLTLAEMPNADCGEVDDLLDEHIRKVQEQRREFAKLERELKALRADCQPSRQVQGCGILQPVSQVAVKAPSRKSHDVASAPLQSKR